MVFVTWCGVFVSTVTKLAVTMRKEGLETARFLAWKPEGIEGTAFRQKALLCAGLTPFPPFNDLSALIYQGRK